MLTENDFTAGPDERSWREKRRERVLHLANEREEFLPLEDGYCYWFPSAGNGGLSSADLRILAEELDRQNEQWNQGIEDYFKSRSAVSSVVLWYAVMPFCLGFVVGSVLGVWSR